MSKRSSKFLFLGAFIGFLAGLFLAPKKGSELRKDAKNKIEEAKENPREVLQETLVGVKDKITTIIDDNIGDNDKIEISEDEIIISKTFNDEGESK